MVDFKQKEKYDINDLLEIMRLLRAPAAARGMHSRLI